MTNLTNWGAAIPAILSAFAAGLTVLPAQAAPLPATCVFGVDPPRSCTVDFVAGPNGSTVLLARSGRRSLRFVGRRSDGWWSGTLGGRRAMGFELNRGNIVFRTADLRTSFQYWTPGSEHGSY